MVAHNLDRPLPFKIASPDFHRDPFSRLAEMRAAGPVIPIKFPIVGKLWMTTTYAATLAVVKDNELFVLEGKNAGKSGAAGLPAWAPKSLKLLTNNMLQKDEPDHRRLRKLVDQALKNALVPVQPPGVTCVPYQEPSLL